MNVLEDAKKEKSWLESMKKKTNKTRISPGEKDENSRNAKKIIESKLKRETDRDIAVMEQAKKLRKQGLEESEVSKIFKFLSGAKKKKASKSISKSIE